MFVCLFLFSSQVLGPIFMKLGGWIKVDPRSVLEGFIFGKVKVTGQRSNNFFATCTRTDLHETWWVDQC